MSQERKNSDFESWREHKVSGWNLLGDELLMKSSSLEKYSPSNFLCLMCIINIVNGHEHKQKV
jgi:hypothetical protein